MLRKMRHCRLLRMGRSQFSTTGRGMTQANPPDNHADASELAQLAEQVIVCSVLNLNLLVEYYNSER